MVEVNLYLIHDILYFYIELFSFSKTAGVLRCMMSVIVGGPYWALSVRT